MMFGLAEEQQHFRERNLKFIEVFPRISNRMDQMFGRAFKSPNKIQQMVFTFGCVIVEDFREILLNCANGYGIAGLKLLRPMFEATVTSIYLARHPEELEAFLEYDCVHQRKGLQHAESLGIDVSRWLSKDEQIEIEANYKAIRGRYRQVCPKCGHSREQPSWTKMDPIAMARDIGIEKASLSFYFFTTLLIHTTVTGISIERAPQRSQADDAVAAAHRLMVLVLEYHNRYFGLGISGLREELLRDVEYAWRG